MLSPDLAHTSRAIWSSGKAPADHGRATPGASVIPYLPPLLDGDAANYHHHVQVRPVEGASVASVTFDRFAWAASESGPEWKLVGLDPLTLTTYEPTPFLVTGPLNLNPQCPQAWVIQEATSASVAISAMPRRPDLPTLRLFPGVIAPAEDAPHTLALPPGVRLPAVRQIVPCRLEVFPLTPMVSIAVRFRVYSGDCTIGDTPYLFRSALYSPRAWEIRDGWRILEEDPNTGDMVELIEATPESGEIGPSVAVFSGRAVATFSWRISQGASVFSVAGLVPSSDPDVTASGHTRYGG